MAGPWRANGTCSVNGTGNVNGSFEIGFKYGFITQVTIDLTSGNGTQFGFNLFEGNNSGTNYTTDDVTSQIIEVANAARTFYNEREFFKYFQCSGNKKLFYNIYNGTGSGANVFSYVVSGIGLG